MGGVKADLRNKGAENFLPAVIDNIVSRSEAMVLER